MLLEFILVALQGAASATLSAMFGSFVIGVGDVDGDTVSDFVIGDEGWPPSGSPAAFWVLSGKDAREIHAFHAPDLAADMPELVVAAGDVDGDQHADLWLILDRNAETTPARVALWSGKTRSVTRAASEAERDAALAWNYFKRPFGDHNGDGVADYTMRGGSVTIRSGKDDKALFDAPEAEHVLLIDDVDGDGRRDVMCTYPRVGVAQGVVHCRSGATGHILWSAADDGFWYFGWMVDVVGDLDGDGTRDWILGGSNHRSHQHGSANLHSGRTGTTLASFTRRERAAAVVDGPLYERPRAR